MDAEECRRAVWARLLRRMGLHRALKKFARSRDSVDYMGVLRILNAAHRQMLAKHGPTPRRPHISTPVKVGGPSQGD